MKNNFTKLSIIFCLSLFSGFAFGQKTSKYKTKTGSEFRFGITAGTAYSFQTGYGYDDKVKGVFGISAGAFANYSFSDKMRIQIAALYNQYGSDFTSSTNSYKETQTYLSVPVTVKAYLSESFYVTLGPQLNVLVSSNFDGNDIKDITEKTDFGITGGLGYNFTSNIGIDLSYYYGLSNIYKKDSGIDGKIIYNAATARLFYEF